MKISIFDLLFLVPLVYGGWRGYYRGAMLQAISILVMLLLVYVATLFGGSVGGWLHRAFSWNLLHWQMALFFFAFVVFAFVNHVTNRYLVRYSNPAEFRSTYRFVGAFLGVFRLVFMVSVLVVLFNQLSDKPKYMKANDLQPHLARDTSNFIYMLRNRTLLYRPALSVAPFVFPFLDFSHNELIERVRLSNMYLDQGGVIPVETAIDALTDSMSVASWRIVLPEENGNQSHKEMVQITIRRDDRFKQRTVVFLIEPHPTRRLQSKLQKYQVNGFDMPVDLGIQSLVQQRIITDPAQIYPDDL